MCIDQCFVYIWGFVLTSLYFVCSCVDFHLFVISWDILFFPCFFCLCVCVSDLVSIYMISVFVCVCRNTPCCMKRPVSSSWLHYRQSWSTGGTSENAGGCVWSVSVLWYMWLQILVRGSVWAPTGMWLRRFFLRWKISCPIPWPPAGTRTPSKSFAFHSMATAISTLSRYKKHWFKMLNLSAPMLIRQYWLTFFFSLRICFISQHVVRATVGISLSLMHRELQQPTS